MIDFHSHILPEMDDGAEDLETSLEMLRMSKEQGVDIICSTSHFYANEEDPESFLMRRSKAYERLCAATGDSREYPKILLGAEVLYFPGISVSEEMMLLRLSGTPFLLIEPPMMPWSESMLEEVEQCGETLHCVPVIAHIDRYMRLLHDYTLFDRVKNRNVLVQVNASFFIHHDTVDFALRCLQEERFQFIGSDCHDLYARHPNMGDAARVIRDAGETEKLARLNNRLYKMIGKNISRKVKPRISVKKSITA